MFKKAERKQALPGDQYGRLTLVEPAGLVGGRPGWKCLCSCGETAFIQQKRLVSGHTKSCGCIRKEGNARKHGNRRRGTTSPTYISWQAMTQRCSDPAHDGFAGYGGAGVTVCERWRSFESFLADMGERPPGTTIDRIEGALGYRPGNCRWATGIEQANNKRTSRQLTLDGITRSLAQWATHCGITEACLRTRIDRLGWSIERAIRTAAKGKSNVQES